VRQRNQLGGAGQGCELVDARTDSRQGHASWRRDLG
jgi:hypothetical protein